MKLFALYVIPGGVFDGASRFFTELLLAVCENSGKIVNNVLKRRAD